MRSFFSFKNLLGKNLNFLASEFSYIVPEPLGVALVMSAWNYPVFTDLPPVASPCEKIRAAHKGGTWR